eukprot:gnl/MRDRNA2_/MRDRNA2_104264_c0_seq1.p1 gnl/MRDRNA2_/MRDRNA2_104264_c0~~gnl/MRDRNA2_/MRDRNA2_104264_c0_seq1.p1  ORF type:complete len:265 (+),score=58.94 gnl/MRDRNA2_/MRDRNA2_104264_c0_seq1:58-852(+)
MVRIGLLSRLCRVTGGTSRLAPVLVLILFAVAADAYGEPGKKKKPFMPHVPMMWKFGLFWWCAFVFVVMVIYIIDALLLKYMGPKALSWSVDHELSGGVDREAFWAQLADPSAWAPTHPVASSAVISMVQDVPEDESYTGLKSVDLCALKEGLSIVMRHKSDAGPRSSELFCTRRCVGLEKPKEGTWKLSLKTTQVGAGYPYVEGSEETVLSLQSKDGKLRCSMETKCLVESRLRSWWRNLPRQGRNAALEMFQMLEANLKKAE